MRNPRLAFLFVLAAASASLTGCAGFHSSGNVAAAPANVLLNGMHGQVFGGQQPLGLTSLQLYQPGTAYGAGSTALIPSGSYYAGGNRGCISGNGQTCYTGVVTDANGNFTLTGDYTCQSGTQVYLTGTGGQASPGITNTSISLIVGLGLCDNLGPNTFLQMNEITTVATVWALAPFMPATPATLPSTIGAPSSNSAGLVSAFADINTLINVANGHAQISTPTTTLPTAEINTLANMLAACVNSAGVGSIGCNALLNYTPNADGSTPSDTLSAALNIARNPGRNVSNLIAAQGTTPPFQPSLSAANDLTLAVTYTGSGISAPSAAAIDANGNVWIANSGSSSSVTELSHTGAVLSGASGFTAGSINAPSAIAVDATGDIWLANGNSTITELSSTGSNMAASPFSGGGLSTPTAMAFDGVGNLWLANAGSNTISEFSANGTALSGTTGYVATGVSAPVAIAINPH